MATKTLEVNSKKTYAYPSRFGSHESMINLLETSRLEFVGNKTDVVLTDEYGDYVTTRNKLDSGEADPARYRESRLGKLFEKSKDRKDS
jgi:hypothetical protein